MIPMIEWYNVWLPLSVVLGAVALFAVYSWRGQSAAKNGAALCFVAASVVAYAALQVPLGYADPRTPADGDYEVLAFWGEPGVGIHVWLNSGRGGPHYYILPWRVGEADKAEKMRQQMQSNEIGNMVVHFGDEGSTFVAVKIPPDPPKEPVQ